MKKGLLQNRNSPLFFNCSIPLITVITVIVAPSAWRMMANRRFCFVKSLFEMVYQRL